MSWWKPAHAGSRSLAEVFENLGHHRLKLLVGLLKEIGGGKGQKPFPPLTIVGVSCQRSPF
jgi:hypothetical protein